MSAGRLVIVDDEPVILKLLGSMLESSPYEVVLCSTGQAGAKAIEEGVDVLLTDKNLPDISGMELLELAKSRDPLCEVILITGYASLDTALVALQKGAFDYIVKPPEDIFHVKRKVEQAFQKVQLSRDNVRLVQRLQTRNEELEDALSRLERAQAELVQSEKLAGIGTLAAGIAHEISSPLFGIMGLAEAIGDENEPPVVKEYASEIVLYTRSIKEIVQQLSGYSRAARLESIQPVALLDVIEGAVRLIHRSMGAQTATGVQVEVAPALQVRANANELQQVFVNLVKNGLEAIADRHGEGGGGLLSVDAKVVDGQVRVQVRDDGSGIPEDQQRSIFDPFFTTKPPGHGTGLGLNIVYRLMTRFRGTIAVHSVVGEGTTFELVFPEVV